MFTFNNKIVYVYNSIHKYAYFLKKKKVVVFDPNYLNISMIEFLDDLGYLWFDIEFTHDTIRKG